MSTAGPTLDGYSIARLGAGDVAELQGLHARCDDYFFLIEGGAARLTSAQEDLVATPPGIPLSDKFLLGLYAVDGAMLGVLDLIRNHPKPDAWWIGLLLLEPRARGRGLGASFYGAARDWIAGQGGRTIHLAVLEQNTAAERFWRRLGFEEQRRSTYTAATGRTSRTIVLSHDV